MASVRLATINVYHDKKNGQWTGTLITPSGKQVCKTSAKSAEGLMDGLIPFVDALSHPHESE